MPNSNQIRFTSRKSGSILTTCHYEGYGYLLSVSYDGFETIVVIEPYDPLYGVAISYFAGRFTLKPPSVQLDQAPLLIENIRKAEAFCSEFSRRKDELLKVLP